MKKKVPVLLFIGVALLLTVAVLSGQMPVSAKGTTVPFKVACQTYPDPEFMEDHIVVTVLSDCKGTHLGKSHWDSVSIVDISQPPPPPPFTQIGDMFFTAANGDQLIGTFSGLAVPNDKGGFDYWGGYEISGGTGRFSNTTGSGTYYGGADGEVGTAVFEGKLTKP